MSACLVLGLSLRLPRPSTDAAAATGPALTIAVAEDAGKQPNAATAKAKMDLAKLAGFTAVRMTQVWVKGQTAPSSTDLTALQDAVGAAGLDGLRPIVSIFNNQSGNTPVTDTDRAQFAQFAKTIASALTGVTDFVVGNEPNNNVFWLPQFNSDGSDAAATAYEALLAPRCRSSTASSESRLSSRRRRPPSTQEQSRRRPAPSTRPPRAVTTSSP